MSEVLAQLKKTLMEKGLENLIFDEQVTIPKNQINTSITFTHEAELIVIFATADNRPPSIYYLDTELFRGATNAPEVTAIGADGKTVSLHILLYGTQYYALNFIMQ